MGVSEEQVIGHTTTVDSNPLDDSNLKHSEDHVEDVVLARLTEEDMFRMSKEAFRFKSWASFRIFLIMVVQGCNQAGYGVDWAVIGGINAFKSWHNYFGFGTTGATIGTINALMSIGNLCGAPFLGLADVIGRRGINFLGNAIVIVAAILQGTSTSLGMFMAGRFLLGFGSSIMSSPQYMAEVAPAHLRGRLVGIFGACFQVGSLAMLGGMIGFASQSDTNNWSWRIPLILEALFPVIVCSTIYFLTPESPRYLILRGKIAEARKVIAKYQTSSGDENSPLVNAVVNQIEESLENDKIVNRQPWNYTVFFKKAARYRFMILVIYSLFQSWNGGGIIGQNLVPALETIGITDSQSQLGINLGTTVVYFVFTACGAFLVDKVKRRTLIFSGLISFIILQTAATITSWQFSVTGSNAAAILTVLWIFLFQFFSSLLVATMHNLYPVEFLSLALRARGMGMYSFVQGTAGVVQGYGISVGIGLIGYKIWVVYIVYNTIQLVVSYFTFPETFGLSLEEIDAVFETPGVRPVKMSLDIQRAKEEKARLNAEGAGL